MRIGQPVEVHADLYGGDVTYDGTIASLGMGTGSAFSLLPAQNASGNWIKIVQRVPVRIELDPKQLAEHPLRLGLSMSVDVSIRDQDGKMLGDSAPQAGKPLLSTRAYATQLSEANALIERVINDNLPQRARACRQPMATTPDRTPGAAPAAGTPAHPCRPPNMTAAAHTTPHAATDSK